MAERKRHYDQHPSDTIAAVFLHQLLPKLRRIYIMDVYFDNWGQTAENTHSSFSCLFPDNTSRCRVERMASNHRAILAETLTPPAMQSKFKTQGTFAVDKVSTSKGFKPRRREEPEDGNDAVPLTRLRCNRTPNLSEEGVMQNTFASTSCPMLKQVATSEEERRVAPKDTLQSTFNRGPVVTDEHGSMGVCIKMGISREEDSSGTRAC